jgi:hypothetical protein
MIHFFYQWLLKKISVNFLVSMTGVNKEQKRKKLTVILMVFQEFQ